MVNNKDLLKRYQPNSKKSPPRRHTPFIEGARNGDPQFERFLRIALAHRILDDSQVSIIGQLELAEMVAKLGKSQAEVDESQAPLTEEEKEEKRRMRAWLPQEKRYKR